MSLTQVFLNGMATALYGNGMATAWQLHGDGMATAWQLHGHGMATAWQLRGNSTYNIFFRSVFGLKTVLKVFFLHFQGHRSCQPVGIHFPLAHARPAYASATDVGL